MDINYIKNNYRFETLTKDHALSDFESDSKDLNDFLKNDALNQQNMRLNLTKLVMCDDELIGFVSLLTDSIIIKDIRDDELKLDIKDSLNISSKRKPLPAIKIGRFAIDKKYSGQKLGSHILRSVLVNLKLISENTLGSRFIVVEGYAKAYNFYVKHNGFVNLKKDDDKLSNLDFIIKRDPERTFYLYLDIENIEY